MMESPPEATATLSPPIYGAYKHIRSLLRPGASALDIGCGNGKVAAYLARETGAVVDGIEPSLGRADVASTRLRYVSVQPASGTISDPLLASKYDLVMLLDVVEHLVDPAPVLKWAGDRAAPDGKVIVLIPNSANWNFRLRMLRGVWRYEEWGLFDRTHVRFYDPESARDLRPEGMIEAGVRYFTPGGAASRLATRLMPRLFALHVLLEWTWRG